MGTTTVGTPTSRVRLGMARADITPPVGIYHRMWGAARHDRATGVHRPLVGDVLVFGAAEGSGVDMIRAHLDIVGLDHNAHAAMIHALADAAGVSPAGVVVTYSHTHSGGLFAENRVPLPGGELIGPHLTHVAESLGEACRQAMARLQPVTISYAVGRCDLAANRDFWDDGFNGHVCGFNPDAPADDTLVLGRIVDESGGLVGTIVNYACHPTTLAWGNTLISPDFVGAMREEVQRATGVPCVFAQGACGDLGPRHGFVGDTAVADKNGRKLGYAALATFETLGPPAADFHYLGPVISGATIGEWAFEPQSAMRAREARRFAGGTFTVDLPLKPKPSLDALQQEITQWETRQREADQAGDASAARDFGARAERARRWIGRIPALPEGATYAFPFSVYRIGDAVWVTTSGEPYNLIQAELRRRFPNLVVLFSPLAGEMAPAYLLPEDRYGKGLYQEEPSILDRGCLEQLIDAVAHQIEAYT